MFENRTFKEVIADSAQDLLGLLAVAGLAVGLACLAAAMTPAQIPV